MVANKHIPMTRADLSFWERAFLAAEVPALLKRRGLDINPAGLAHLASEFADAAVVERRRRRNGGAK